MKRLTLTTGAVFALLLTLVPTTAWAQDTGRILGRILDAASAKPVPGAQVFVNKGINGRWRDTLSPEDIAEYEARAVKELGPRCARWLATGDGMDR